MQYKYTCCIDCHTFDEPFTVPIDRVVPRTICDISRGSPEDLPVALTVSRPTSWGLCQNQNHQNQGDREDRGHPYRHLQQGAKG